MVNRDDQSIIPRDARAGTRDDVGCFIGEHALATATRRGAAICGTEFRSTCTITCQQPPLRAVQWHGITAESRRSDGGAQRNTTCLLHLSRVQSGVWSAVGKSLFTRRVEALAVSRSSSPPPSPACPHIGAYEPLVLGIAENDGGQVTKRGLSAIGITCTAYGAAGFLVPHSCSRHRPCFLPSSRRRLTPRKPAGALAHSPALSRHRAPADPLPPPFACGSRRSAHSLHSA